MPWKFKSREGRHDISQLLNNTFYIDVIMIYVGAGLGIMLQ